MLIRRTITVTVITAALAGFLTGCSTDACEAAYDALWMTRYYSDGTKACTYIGEPGDSTYNVGGVTELPYP